MDVGWVIAVLTLCLVAATIYYAWRTGQMVRIMAEQQVASVRPVLVFALREGDFRVCNVGAGPAINGLYETSHRETKSHHVTVAGRSASHAGQVDPLGPGEADYHRVHFQPHLHALLTCEDLAGRKYWSRYCSKTDWRTGEGTVAPGDFGCSCKLDERGLVIRTG
jgi:hypothetical protein